MIFLLLSYYSKLESSDGEISSSTDTHPLTTQTSLNRLNSTENLRVGVCVNEMGSQCFLMTSLFIIHGLCQIKYIL